MLPCLSECILPGTALGVSGHFTNQKTEVWGWTRPRQGSPAPLGPKAVCLQVPTLHVQLFLSLRYRKTPKSQAHPGLPLPALPSTLDTPGPGGSGTASLETAQAHPPLSSARRLGSQPRPKHRACLQAVSWAAAPWVSTPQLPPLKVP